MQLAYQVRPSSETILRRGHQRQPDLSRLAYHSSVVFQAPRGTQDILPEDAPYWALVEDEMRRQARLANYGEIRTPTFEETGVFQRGVGATTDIVEKEMYTFLDKGGDSMTLRPEATAGIMRAYLQRGMASRPQPVKLFTLLNTFRYDKPQKGRFREFHQIDFEAIGEADPLVDAELVGPAVAAVRRRSGLRNLSLQVNSIGDTTCRPAVHRQAGRLLSASISTACARNASAGWRPIRCACSTRRGPSARPCSRARRAAPTTCATTAARTSRRWLATSKRRASRSRSIPRLVRGLDYYTRSVWEVWPPVVGAQSTLGGGGRYDGLAEQLGGRPTPGVGFASGVERIILELKDQQVSVPAVDRPTCSSCTRPRAASARPSVWPRRCAPQGISADLSFGDRKLGKQLGAADRRGRTFAVDPGRGRAGQRHGHAQGPARRAATSGVSPVTSCLQC